MKKSAPCRCCPAVPGKAIRVSTSGCAPFSTSFFYQPLNGVTVTLKVGASTVATCVSSGGITTVPVTATGSGYSSASVTISGDGAGASATANLSGGQVTGIAIVNPGHGYTNATATITGDGTGASLGTPTITAGTCYFADLPNATYTITGTYPNYDTATATQVIDGTTPAIVGVGLNLNTTQVAIRSCPGYSTTLKKGGVTIGTATADSGGFAYFNPSPSGVLDYTVSGPRIETLTGSFTAASCNFIGGNTVTVSPVAAAGYVDFRGAGIACCNPISRTLHATDSCGNQATLTYDGVNSYLGTGTIAPCNPGCGNPTCATPLSCTWRIGGAGASSGFEIFTNDVGHGTGCPPPPGPWAILGRRAFNGPNDRCDPFQIQLTLTNPTQFDVAWLYPLGCQLTWTVTE